MTREILFRGKRVDNGEWVEGDLFNNYDGRKFIGELIVNDYTGNAHDDYELGVGFYEVDPETVGQWTGLVDKNGVKIFEGDVLDTPRWVVTYAADVNESLHMNAGWYIQRDDFESWEELENVEDHVVLGNIYDNPELMERKER